MTTEELQECLLRGFGYRKSSELRGEYIASTDGKIVNTLHTVDVWERDRSGQSGNPLNDDMDEWDAYEEDGPMDLEDQLDAAFARADRPNQK